MLKPGLHYYFVFMLLAIAGIGSCEPGNRAEEYQKSGPLVLRGQHDKVISYLDITGDTADCILLIKCYNITIKNSRFRHSKKNGVTILAGHNIKVLNCYFENLASGITATESERIDISNNNFKNMQGPFPRGQFAQFDAVYGGGNKINYNNGENIAGQSDAQDAINIYKTHGTAANPVQVIGNRIRGGGPSNAGGGIMLGDNGGAYIIAKDNILVDPGQYGMAIAGGNHISIINNTIYGRRQPFTNVGLYIWNQHTSGCELNTVAGNKVNFTNAKGEPNAGWNQGNCGQVAGWEANQFGAKIDGAILPKQILTVEQ
ncbi:right-handed parallel beta-helix repeat-containing protein [Mucilaginibacter sp. ZT4R22]|uniref:Right-handed parallel beta-helix repeat-containing protein n=1 Tax=Mucilaginibacter pankratovii TaxID=2772110 RepID=A0ABR7WUH6_9SPHI|nr:right-handed parallel beta-helix repeat-containing protein [Mucilaginibacter pankratovii]MBD1365044.1 right-handed parallel beta-helix repeat-containing protein [Mucilaginibacter pankratovii]